MTDVQLRQWSESVYGAYHTGEGAERYGRFLGVVEGDRDTAHAQAHALLVARNGCVATISDEKIAPAEQPSTAVVWHDENGPAASWTPAPDLQLQPSCLHQEGSRS